MQRRRKDPVWNVTSIKRKTQAIREELGKLPQSPLTRLHHCLTQITELEDVGSREAPLRRFIYIVNALLLHEATGSLKPSQVTSLVNLGQGILKAHRILPTTSKLSVLYGQLHLALAHIYRREGKHWDAIFEQQLSYTLSQRMPSGGRDYQQFFMGISAARMGQTSLVEDWLQGDKIQGLRDWDKSRAELERIKLLRLSGELDQAEKLAQEYLAQPHLKEPQKGEPRWELLCIKAQRTGNIHPLLTATAPGEAHHHLTYLLEAFMWTRAIKSRRHMQKYPSLRKFIRDPAIKINRKQPLVKMIGILENAYDGSIPYVFRLKDIRKVVSGAPALFGLENELLLLACTIRWLSRNRNYWLAGILLTHYQGRSLAMSQGKTTDCLGVLGDLNPNEWAMPGSDKEAA